MGKRYTVHLHSGLHARLYAPSRDQGWSWSLLRGDTTLSSGRGATYTDALRQAEAEAEAYHQRNRRMT